MDVSNCSSWRKCPTFLLRENRFQYISHLMCWTSFRHQILYSYSVQMDHLQRLSPRNWQMKIGKASDVPVNLYLCVTDIIGEFLWVCKSSLPLTAKLFLSVVAVRKTLQAVLSQETPTSWLDQTVLWDLLWSLNHQPLHT